MAEGLDRLQRPVHAALRRATRAGRPSRSAERRAWTRPDSVASARSRTASATSAAAILGIDGEVAAARDRIDERLAEERRRERDRRAAEAQGEDDGERAPLAGQVGVKRAASSARSAPLAVRRGATGSDARCRAASRRRATFRRATHRRASGAAGPDIRVVAEVGVLAELRRARAATPRRRECRRARRRSRRGRARRRPARPTPPCARATPRGPPP